LVVVDGKHSRFGGFDRVITHSLFSGEWLTVLARRVVGGPSCQLFSERLVLWWPCLLVIQLGWKSVAVSSVDLRPGTKRRTNMEMRFIPIVGTNSIVSESSFGLVECFEINLDESDFDGGGRS
jgi:hypothetical protein